MKFRTLPGVLLVIFLLNVGSHLSAQSIQYLSPTPNSKYNNTAATIIIGFTGKLTANNLNNLSITVTGSKSGLHSGSIIPVEGNTKVIFRPETPFALDEKVIVSGNTGNLNYSFFTRVYPENGILPDNSLKNILQSGNILQGTDNPKDLPVFTIQQNGPTAEGYLFFSNFTGGSSANYLIQLNNNGTPHYFKLLTAAGYDYKRQPNNLTTYYEEMRHFYYGLDENHVVVDSFYCGNGYNTDLHELQLTPDGGAWLMAYDMQIIDMRQIIPGGYQYAQVTGLIIQKIDQDKNVVFQWSSWDHIPITDATHENLLATAIDYVHGNAIEPMDDNSILISSRHLDEITKISTITGDIIWRLGGKQNQFNFINDTLKFSHQHSIRYLGDEHVLLFDNGNFHTPSFSRAVEYKLDIANKTATLVWQYRNTPDIYAFAMGSVQRLPNGNTLIGWGSATTAISEVTPEGELVYELKMPAGYMSYRAFRFDLAPVTHTGNESGIVRNYTLGQNYPNPFNPVTTIKFSLPENSFVNLSIYDITGRKVGELINSQMKAGSYSEKWNGAGFASGIYFYSLSTDKFRDTKKMILVK